MTAMFWLVQIAGCVPRWMAAFSAGRPKESQPIGWSTWRPRIHWKRATASPIE